MSSGLPGATAPIVTEAFETSPGSTLAQSVDRAEGPSVSLVSSNVTMDWGPEIIVHAELPPPKDPSLSFLGAVSKQWVDTGHEGIRYLRFSANGNYQGHIVEIDLRRPEYDLRFTRPEERGQTVSQFAARVGAIVAVNGDMWNTGVTGQPLRPDGSRYAWGDYQPLGLAVTGGQHWAQTADDANHVFLACDAADQCLTDRPGTAEAPRPDWVNVVGGNMALVLDGNPATYHDTERNPRTAVGVTQDGKLLLVVVEGRQTDAVGATLDELAQIFAEMGADSAINLDGGGSSALYLNGVRVSDVPDAQAGAERGEAGQHAARPGIERAVANLLAVVPAAHS